MSAEITRDSPLTEWPPAPGRKFRSNAPINPTLYHVRGCVDGRVVVRSWDGHRWRYSLEDVHWFSMMGMLADGVYESATVQRAEAEKRAPQKCARCPNVGLGFVWMLCPGCQQAAQCETCLDWGEIGGLTPNGYDGEPCPDCERETKETR